MLVSRIIAIAPQRDCARSLAQILRFGKQRLTQDDNTYGANPKRLATRFSTPCAITSDCGTLPSAGNAKSFPLQ